MHSRAYLLLKRDLINLERLPIQGISAHPYSDDNVYQWTAKIEGIKGTVWEGGIFQLRLQFSEYYNTCPPKIHFMTIPFHPNVDPDNGIPSLHLLKDGWNEECSLNSLLLALQSLLNNPEMDSRFILNKEAAELYKDAPHTYKQLALDCVTASLRIEAGLTPHESEIFLRPHSRTSSLKTAPIPSSSSRPISKPVPQRLKPVSFDDYHLLWKGIATSVSNDSTVSQFIQLLDKDKSLRKIHFKTEQHRQDDLTRRMKEHLTLKYGISKRSDHKENKTVNTKDYREKRIAELMSLYKQHAEEEDPGNEADFPDEGVKEIDDLLKWSTSLDENELN